MGRSANQILPGTPVHSHKPYPDEEHNLQRQAPPQQPSGKVKLFGMFCHIDIRWKNRD